MPKPRRATKTTKRREEMISLVRRIVEQAGLAADSMAVTTGRDRIAEDKDGDWRVGNKRGTLWRKGAMGILNKFTEEKKTKVAHARERRCKFRGEDGTIP
jgi:hypothetical protein